MNMPEPLFSYRNPGKFSLLYLFAVPIIVFLYFLQWKTHVFYGDDLFTYNHYQDLKTFTEKMNMSLAAQKFRPIQGIVVQLLIDSFEKNAGGYYWFNILVQSLNTFIFAALLNLYLKSRFFSIGFSLLLGLSRLAFFNITQIINGGVLEGLAMSFFLLFLYYTVKALQVEQENNKVSKDMLWATVFANLSMYTHERYVVLFPFLLLVLIFGNSVKRIDKKEKIGLIALVLASILLNVLIKRYVVSIPYFVGTGGVSIQFSFAAAFSFLKEALSAIFLVNTGPEYLVGIKYDALTQPYRLLTVILIAGIFVSMIVYLVKEFKKKFITPATIDFLLLIILFFLCLAPAIVTIRLEQRWLQASFSVFILLTVIAFTSFKFRNKIVRSSFFMLFILAFLAVDREYLSKGASNIYLMSAERLVSTFKKAIDNGSIRQQVKNLYILEQQKDLNAENGVNFTLVNGDFFYYYGGKGKKLIYVDSVYERSHSLTDTTFLHFNPQTDQIIYVNDKVYDITNKFLRDSLRNIDVQQIQTDPNLQ